MHTSMRRVIIATFAICFIFNSPGLWAQTAGSAGTIYGTVTDTTGAIVPGATVTISNPVSGLTRTATSDEQGRYQFTNLPFNPYHLAITMTGFSAYSQDVTVSSVVPITLKTALAIGSTSTVVDVNT